MFGISTRVGIFRDLVSSSLDYSINCVIIFMCSKERLVLDVADGVLTPEEVENLSLGPRRTCLLAPTTR